ncbi:hypothetical protein RFI_03021 [Reticulomyxa filosa]|uniref:Uncharacterized protein n=1 Tax=Reticulomyxa filosa TaxID=46433 RepID=X6P784_RETFI|nr:hypothetical protein RFI_03021 [Reticulomyxa filosa]|eukprot:ETO34071.1 hypothetical protein RFI_03021 [Reticulomyxa filosa]
MFFSLKKKKGFVGFAVVIHNFAELYLIRNSLLGIAKIIPLFIGFALSNIQITQSLLRLDYSQLFFYIRILPDVKLGIYDFWVLPLNDVLVCHLYVSLFISIFFLTNKNGRKYFCFGIEINSKYKDMPLNEKGNAKQPSTTRPMSLELELELVTSGNVKSQGIIVDDAVSTFYDADEVASGSDNARAREFAEKGAIVYFKIPSCEVAIIFAFLIALGRDLLLLYYTCFNSDSAICKG